MAGPVPFVPLRTDPPPELAPTLWLRSAVVVAILVGAVAVCVTDLDGPLTPGPLEIAVYLVVAALLACWSVRSMGNVDALLPPSAFRRRSGGTTIGALWLVAFATPPSVVWIVGRLGDEVPDPDAVVPTSATIAAVLLALVATWAPFRYHVVQAARIGVPPAPISRWYWVPVATFVAALVLLAYAYRLRYGTGEPAPVGIGGACSLATAAFAWTTWRAVTVFDEVIDLRWERWRVEWERTLRDMIAQPPPVDRDVADGREG